MPKSSPVRTTQDPPRRPPEGALLRCILDSDRWAESLPPVPSGRLVTLSFTSSAALVEHGEACELLGFRVVGRPTDDPGAAVSVADLLVTQDVIDRHPTWWRALATHADRVYSLAHGPAVALLRTVLDPHLAILAAEPDTLRRPGR